ncbi:uncharacterized protein LOC124404932 isoform X2 [Diprion similis]|uniref:uncharacterized protein LOC124404932 isoform X2 n=1 Tax=Diprion similis TaxID=362088 RepID=UPI001EF7F830|nr:uncharacterized protein LOC124404932 isoform X2 [Diprion similis]
MGLYGCSPKVTAIVAGLFTLVQSLLWVILGIISLLVYSCKIYVTTETLLAYRLYLVYLYSGECGSAEIEVETDNGTVVLAWPESGASASGRTYAWIVVYLVLSSFWFIAALLLLIASWSDVRGPKGLKLRGPWLVLTSIFLVLDVITSLLYAIDITYTSDLLGLLEFVGGPMLDTISSSSTSPTFEYFTMAPSIIALIIFSRGIIGWTLNLTILVHVAQDIRQRELPPPPTVPEPRQPYQEYLKKLSTVGPVPDIKWDPYQRKRSELPVLKPLKVPSPPNERKRKQSDYQQYMFYANHPPKLNYLDDIISEPPTPAVGAVPTTTRAWPITANQEKKSDDLKSSKTTAENQAVPEPDYESDFPAMPEFSTLPSRSAHGLNRDGA